MKTLFLNFPLADCYVFLYRATSPKSIFSEQQCTIQHWSSIAYYHAYYYGFVGARQGFLVYPFLPLYSQGYALLQRRKECAGVAAQPPRQHILSSERPTCGSRA